MVHLVEQRAYVGATPWHGLGNRLTQKQPLEVWQREAGMNGQIQESPGHFKADTVGNLGSIHSFPEQKVLYRSDTKAPLSVVSKPLTKDSIQSLPGPSPDGCSLAQGNACKPYGRLNVVIGDDDPLRTLAARLQYFQAISGNRLACLPLELRLRGKSTRQSHGTPIFYADITVRGGLSMEDALLAAKQRKEIRQAAGFGQTTLDRVARQGFNNGTL
jgi:hypothetical protein